MDGAIITLVVLAIAAFLFVTELIPLAVTSMAACTALGILGVLKSKEVYSGLSDTTVVLFGGMFVIGAAMFKTGLAQAIGEAVVRKAGTKETRLMSAVMLITIAISSVSSNTGTVACLMPVIVGMCQAANVSASRQLMPLAIAANVGGTITMIGTPPNVIVTGALSAAGLPTFGFFEFAWIGIPLSIVVFLFTITVGRLLLPKGKDVGQMDEEAVKAAKEEAGAGDEGAPKNKTKMWISGLIMLGVVVCMALDIKTLPLHTAAVTGAILCVITGCLKEKEAYAGIDWVTIFLFAGMLGVAGAMEKTGAGKLIADTVVGMVGSDPNPYVLTGVLFLISNVLTQFMSNTAAAALLAPIGISIAESIGADPKPVLMAIGIAASMAYATPMATPPNTLVLGPGNFSFNDYVKIGVPLSVVILLVTLTVGRVLLPKGKTAGAMDEDAVKAAQAEAGAGGNAPKSKAKMWISGLIMAGVVLCMALDLKTVPLHTAAVTGAILCVITGCLKEKEAYAGIDWVTIFLFAGMLAVATAMEKTGAGKLIADTIVEAMGENPNPYVLTGVLFTISCVLTQFMSNTASAALLAPIGISIAQSIGVDPKPVLMALGIAASCAFATPMATPPNTLVLGPGGFSFNDYVKIGVPYGILSLIICLAIIPVVWPFR